MATSTQAAELENALRNHIPDNHVKTTRDANGAVSIFMKTLDARHTEIVEQSGLDVAFRSHAGGPMELHIPDQ